MDALFFRRLGGIERAFRPLRVSRNAALLGKFLKIIRAIPIATSLPDVAGHVIEAVAIWGKRFHGRNTGKSIFAFVLNRELSLIAVGRKLPARLELIAPRIELSAQASPRGKLPLGLRRQPLARPFCVGDRVGIADLHHRIVFLALYVALWTFWVPPVRAVLVTPPPVMIGQRHRAGCRSEDDRTGHKALWRRSRKLFFGRRAFRYGDVAGRLDEFLKLGVGDIRRVHPEAIDVDAMYRKRIGDRGR